MIRHIKSTLRLHTWLLTINSLLLLVILVRGNL
jgi:hypothetical protein